MHLFKYACVLFLFSVITTNVYSQEKSNDLRDSVNHYIFSRDSLGGEIKEDDDSHVCYAHIKTKNANRMARWIDRQLAQGKDIKHLNYDPAIGEWTGISRKDKRKVCKSFSYH